MLLAFAIWQVLAAGSVPVIEPGFSFKRCPSLRARHHDVGDAGVYLGVALSQLREAIEHGA